MNSKSETRNSKLRVAIFGGSGYGGSELLRILLGHPNAEIKLVTANEHAGKAVDQGDLKVAADDPKQLSVGLNPITAGTYQVKFRVLSVDGHVVENHFPFTVRDRR